MLNFGRIKRIVWLNSGEIAGYCSTAIAISFVVALAVLAYYGAPNHLLVTSEGPTLTLSGALSTAHDREMADELRGMNSVIRQHNNPVYYLKTHIKDYCDSLEDPSRTSIPHPALPYFCNKGSGLYFAIVDEKGKVMTQDGNDVLHSKSWNDQPVKLLKSSEFLRNVVWDLPCDLNHTHQEREHGFTDFDGQKVRVWRGCDTTIGNDTGRYVMLAYNSFVEHGRKQTIDENWEKLTESWKKEPAKKMKWLQWSISGLLIGGIVLVILQIIILPKIRNPRTSEDYIYTVEEYRQWRIYISKIPQIAHDFRNRMGNLEENSISFREKVRGLVQKLEKLEGEAKVMTVAYWDIAQNFDKNILTPLSAEDNSEDVRNKTMEILKDLETPNASYLLAEKVIACHSPIRGIPMLNISRLANDICKEEGQLRSHIKFDVTPHSEDNPILIRLNKEDANIILKNLIGNAFRHAETEVEVRISITFEEELVVRVYNDGEVVDESNEIWEPGVSRSEVGSGQGLVNVDKIVSAYSGSRRHENVKNGHRRVLFEVTLGYLKN